MEAVEQMAAPPGPDHNNALNPIAKRKRTKRQRLLSPIPFSIIPPPPSAAAHHHLPPISPTLYTASSEESTTTEEVNTARCLILLSQGRTHGGGACMYTCKTCGRSFPSFQALGGHRASHRKPRNEKTLAIFSDDEEFHSPSISSSKINRISPNSLSLQLSSVSTSTYSPSPRIHECSYCGAEFTSGQALGGHMRKHRAAGPIPRPALYTPPDQLSALGPEELKRAGNGIALDLNLPAPEDDERERARKKQMRGFAHHYYSTID